MKQRAKELGGELRLTNLEPGTLVELEIPFSSTMRDLAQRWTDVLQTKAPLPPASS